MIQSTIIAVFSVSSAVTITAVMLWALTKILESFSAWICHPPYGTKEIFTIIIVSLWLIFTMILSIAPWSFTFYLFGSLSDFSEAFYFASVTYTTLGYGDIVLANDIRVLSGLCAANGMLMFGLFTAFLVEFIKRLRIAHKEAAESQR